MPAGTIRGMEQRGGEEDAQSRAPGARSRAVARQHASHPGPHLTFVQAPAGFGKTRFLDEIDAALANDGLRASRWSMASEGAAEAVRERLGRLGEAEAIILDDIDAAPEDLRRRLATALDQGGQGFRLFAAGRARSALPFARARAQGRVSLVGASELRLSRRAFGEAFASRLGGAAPRIWNLTHGWPAAAELFAQQIERGARIEDDAELMAAAGLADYVDEEVAAALSAERREALILAGVFTAPTRELIEAMAPEGDLGRRLAEVAEDLPGLVDLDAGRFHLNPALRLWTARQFDRRLAPTRAAVLRRAADACAAAGEVVEAVEIAVRGGQTERIPAYVRQAGGVRLWVVAGYGVIRELVRLVGARGVAVDPLMKLLRCVVHLKDGEIVETERLLAEAAQGLPRDAEARRDLEVVRATLMVYGCRPMTSQDLEVFRRTVLRRDDDPALKSLIITIQGIFNTQQAKFDAAVANFLEARLAAEAVGSAYNLLFLDIHMANIALPRGRLAEARGLLARARGRWRRDFPDDVGAETVLAGLSASLEYEAGRIAVARAELRRSAARLPHSEAWFEVYTAAYEPMFRLMARDEGVGAALAAMREAQAELKSQGLGRVGDLLETVAGCIVGETWLRTGDLVAPLPAIEPPGASAAWQEREAGALRHAYGRMAAGDARTAAAGLERFIEVCRASGLGRSELRALLLLTAAWDQAGDGERADHAFAEALAAATETGQVQALSDFGGRAVARRIVRLNASLEAGAAADPETVRLVGRLTRGLGDAAGTVVSFTSRERQVLQALEAGGSDKMIGRRLGVSEHAVRFHLKNVFSKLRVSDRVEAVYQARRAGLLG